MGVWARQIRDGLEREERVGGGLDLNSLLDLLYYIFLPEKVQEI